MPWLDIFLTEIRIAKLAEHGLTFADVESAVFNPIGDDVSDSTGRPIRFGHATDGRKIAVVFEKIDEITIEVFTAYEVK